MVKADVKRDYYADLELPSTADSEEIKKQFRLLGRRDRGLCLEDICLPPQLNNIIQTVTQVMKSRSFPSSRPSKPHMRS